MAKQITFTFCSFTEKMPDHDQYILFTFYDSEKHICVESGQYDQEHNRIYFAMSEDICWSRPDNCIEWALLPDNWKAPE